MLLQPFDPMEALETWTYDAHTRKFRGTWTDSMGCIGTGEGTFDADTNTLNYKATSNGAWGKSTMKGWMRVTQEGRYEFAWTEYMGLTKTMEMSGSGKRIGN